MARTGVRTASTGWRLRSQPAAISSPGSIYPGNNALEPLTRDGFMLWREHAVTDTKVQALIAATPALNGKDVVTVSDETAAFYTEKEAR